MSDHGKDDKDIPITIDRRPYKVPDTVKGEYAPTSSDVMFQVPFYWATADVELVPAFDPLQTLQRAVTT